MQITKKVELTYTADQIVKIICDKCEKEILIASDPYIIDEVLIEFENGQSYGSDGGMKVTKTIQDLCSKCKEELLTLLESNGYKFIVQEIDW